MGAGRLLGFGLETFYCGFEERKVSELAGKGIWLEILPSIFIEIDLPLCLFLPICNFLQRPVVPLLETFVD